MKYFISILLLVCANIILLTHSTMDHHHHHGGDMDITAHACSHAQDSHHHDEGPMPEDCLLNNVFSLPILNSQKDNTAANYYELIAIVIHTSLEPIPENEQTRHRPYLLEHHSFLITHSNSLRGPPSYYLS